MTATLRNIMHGKMQPIPAFVSPACADVIRKALTRSAKVRITLDELADHPWIQNRAQDFPTSLSSGGCTATRAFTGWGTLSRDKCEAFHADAKGLLR